MRLSRLSAPSSSFSAKARDPVRLHTGATPASGADCLPGLAIGLARNTRSRTWEPPGSDLHTPDNPCHACEQRRREHPEPQ